MKGINATKHEIGQHIQGLNGSLPESPLTVYVFHDDDNGADFANTLSDNEIAKYGWASGGTMSRFLLNFEKQMAA